ncbi:hypothetical protein SH449x_004114 [Pirellulaceae bacterium SH449]
MYFPLLAPQVLTNVISQQAAVSEWLLNLFGVNHGADTSDPLFDSENDIAKGVNVLNFGHGRNGAFNVFNNSRTVAKGRAPGTAAAQSGLQDVKTVPFTYPRMYDSIRLLAETFHNLGLISDPAQRDLMGRRMIEMQTRVKAQQAANWRKAALIGSLRSVLKARKVGEDVNWSFTTGQEVSNQIPAGNLGQLNMLGAGNIISATWANAGTKINDHLDGINTGFQKLCGGALRAGILPGNVWSAIIGNDQIRGLAGIANPPFETLKVDINNKVAVTMKNVKIAKIVSQPQATFYITDEHVVLDDGEQQIVPAGKGIFCGFEPDDGTVAIYEGSEPVAEFDGGPETLRTGFSSWYVKKSNPTATEVYFLDNAMPVIHVPTAIAFADLIF